MSQDSLLCEPVKTFCLPGEFIEAAVVFVPVQVAVFIGDIQWRAVQAVDTCTTMAVLLFLSGLLKINEEDNINAITIVLFLYRIHSLIL